FSQRRTRGEGVQTIVTLGFEPGYFTRFYEQFVKSEPGLVMTLASDDGITLARWPPSTRIPQNVSAGPPAPAEQPAGREPERLAVVRALPGYPLRVEAAIERGAVLARWYR